ncbi:MAG: hypothetical protein U1E40_13090 [Amaricoccus sp.]
MDPTKWNATIARICPQDSDDLDDLLGGFAPQGGEAGRDLFALPEADLMPLTALRRADAVCVGIRVAAGDGGAADRAMRLAAFGLERDVEIVVLSENDRSGLERFGFRVDRISGETPEERAACEDQLRRFWNLDIVM